MACALLIFLWVHDELRVDKFHEKDERLYQVMEHQQYAEGIMTTVSTPGLLAETLAEEMPEFEYTATVLWPTTFTLSVGEKNIKSEGHYVGGDFFHLFTYPLLRGNPDHVLSDLNGIVLSERTAEALFGSVGEAMGQSVERDHEEVFTVTGVFADVPAYSSCQFDYLLSYENFKKKNDWLLEWGNNSPSTFAVLREGADPAAVSAKIADFVRKRVEDSHVTLFLKRFSEQYLFGRYQDGKPAGGRIEYVRLF